MMENSFNEAKAIQLAKESIEKHYEDKFVYALPDWAMLTGNPEIVAVVEVHGLAGIAIKSQRVDFPVDFKDKSSIVYYVDFLNKQMNKQLEIIGYIVLFDKHVYVQKDPNYKHELTEDEKQEIMRHNQRTTEIEISILTLNKDHQVVDQLSA